MNNKSFYVTTPIYYVNDKPHIGHAYTTIAADIIARYKRMCGYKVYFLTGTDEHGQKMEEAATTKGITPKELADTNMSRFSKLWEKLNISNDDFIRTTDIKHKEAVLKIFKKIKENGDIYLGEYEGWYCTPCESYWTETQLLEGNLCPDCSRPTSKLKEPSYFFKLSKFQDQILEYINKNPSFIRPESRKNEIISFIKEGLKDLSISRTNFSWGIPVPNNPKHIIYVWIDALTNYLSAIDYFDNNNPKKDFWPANYHIVGKDILRFHTVYWPAMLLSAGIELPKSVFAHGWWTVDGKKMSKSLGNAIDPYNLTDIFTTDQFRYFLMREVPFGLDGDFSYKSLINRINGELANDLGNLLSRSITMLHKYFKGNIPEYNITKEADNKVYNAIKNTADNLDNYLNKLAFNKALISIWELISIVNKYINEMQPWTLAIDKSNLNRLGSVLYTILDSLRAISYFIYPFMPNTSIEIRNQLALNKSVILKDFNKLKEIKQLKSGTILPKNKVLFPRIDEQSMLEKLAKDNNTKQKDELIDFSKFEEVVIKAGKILAAENIKKSDKLLKLSIDIGEKDNKTIISGIGKSFKPYELIGLTVSIVTNLTPVKLMGIESQGMLLAAFDGIKHQLLTLSDTIKPGTRIK